MRKITTATAGAFEARRKLTQGNTHTDGQALYLHGNKIAEWRGAELWITLAGWPTVTTRERLNGLRGVSVSQRAGVQQLNGEAWSGDWHRVNV